MTEIERKIEKLQDISAIVAGQLQALQAIRDNGKATIDSIRAALEAGEEPNPEDTEALDRICVKGAILLKDIHENTARLHNGGHLVHADMARALEGLANEGNKDWPPQP